MRHVGGQRALDGRRERVRRNVQMASFVVKTRTMMASKCASPNSVKNRALGVGELRDST